MKNVAKNIGGIVCILTFLTNSARGTPTWTTSGAGTMSTGRANAAATLLPNGKVLVSGGNDGSGGLQATTELYDPLTGTWSMSGSMSTSRVNHAAILLPSGKILVTGGYGIPSGYLSTAELYDPAFQTWSPTGSMSTPRDMPAAVLLPSGKVLVIGGQINGTTVSSTAELYDPTTGTWSAAGSMSTPRYGHTALMLPNGKVLVSGGIDGAGSYLPTAEIYDPASNTWSTTGSMSASRYAHSAILLPNGKVLVAGGSNGSISWATAELYDPGTGTWSNTGSMSVGRWFNTMTLLPNGQVLVAGGANGGTALYLSTTELYDPKSGTWSTAGSLSMGRKFHNAILLPNGAVLVIGGATSSASASATAELYNPSVGAFVATASMSTVRALNSATLLPSGKVLVAGGGASTAELYDATSGTWSPAGSMSTTRSAHAAILLPTGKVLVVGGGSATTELYDPMAGTWSLTGSMSTVRLYPTATLLPNGKVLVAGGENPPTYLSSAELYDPATGAWFPTGSMSSPRYKHTATLLLNGKVLVAGGSGGGAYLATAETYDPATGIWSPTNSMSTTHFAHTATLLQNGKVLVAGGENAAFLSEAELYDPASGIWSITGSMSTSRAEHAATSLPNGKILVTGGDNLSGVLSTAELYDPASGAWNSAGSMSAPRYVQTATLLPNGRILIAGGDTTGAVALASAETALYTEYNYAGISPSIQPTVKTVNGSASFPIILNPGNSVTVVGSSFTGVSEGSGGVFAPANSPANLPRIYFRNNDTGGNNASNNQGGAIIDLSTSIYTHPLSSGTLTFDLPASMNCGYYNFWIQSNAVPSTFTIVRVLPLLPVLPPTLVSPTFLAVGTATLTARWAPTGEVGVQNYILEASSAPDFSSILSQSSLLSPNVSSATLTGLASTTAYYFRVAAENCAGLGPFLVLGSTTTLSPPPGQPGVPVGAALGVSSINWNWTAATNAMSYSVYLATDTANPIGTTATTAFSQTGLLPNTTYSIVITAVNGGGTTAVSAAATQTYTFATPPSATTITAVYVSSLTLNWNLNGNPIQTVAQVEKSTDGASFRNVFTGAASALVDSNLLSCTTYYYRVRNQNAAGIATAYDSLVASRTKDSPPLPPSGLAAASLSGNRVSLAWAPSPSPEIVAYRLYYDAGSGNINYSVPLATLPSPTTSYTTGILVSSAAYKFDLRALDQCGFEDSNTGVVASAASLSSPSDVSAAIKVPDSGKRVRGNRVTIVAELLSGTAALTGKVLFQYKPSTASAWADVAAAGANHPNPALTLPYLIHWDVTNLTTANYDLRAVATDISGNPDLAPPSITISVNPVNFDISENSLGGEKIEKDQVVNNAVANTIQAGDESSTQLAQVTIPAAAVYSATTTVTVVSNPAGLPAPPVGAGTIGAAVQITLSNGQSLLSGGQTAPITISYPDTDDDGIVDGTIIRADHLQMYSYDVASGSWKKDFASKVDIVHHSITGNTPHFSLFAVFAPAAADLSTVRVYPNPFKPDGGDPNQGVAFSPGNANSGITFDNLPQSVTIKIYTPAGQLVKTLNSANSTGKLQWDAKNDDGRNVASGGYIAIISSPGQSSITKKILIIR